MITTRERLIVAMDLSTLESVKCTLENIGDAVSYYKIGMESFYSLGEAALSLMAANRKKVFLDLKLHDIPNTVSRSVKALCRYAPAMTTLHAAGGPAMLRAAVEAAAEASAQLDQERPKLLGITVLTSIDETEWAAVGHTRPIQDSVLRLAEMCRQSGMDGVVASPQEAAAIRQCCGPDFLIVTPGIRPLYGEKGDQSRTATPAEALRNGADFLVVGRPILAAADPRIAAIEIVKEMEG
jgi:orotidine-5'-phosphate decarboxylase